MRVLVQNTLTNRQWVAYEGAAGFTVGRGEDCQVQLDSRFISAVHARIERGAGQWEIELPEGVNPIEVDGEPLAPGTRLSLKPVSQARIIEFVVTFDDTETDAGDDLVGERELTELQNVLHANVLHRLDLRLDGGTSTEPDVRRLEQLNAIVDELLFGEFEQQIFHSPLTHVLLKRGYRQRLSMHVARRNRDGQKTRQFQEFGHNPAIEETLDTLTARLAAAIGIDDGDAEARIDEHFDQQVGAVIEQTLENARVYLIGRLIKKLLFDIIFGFGPLQDLIEASDVSEIMVVNPSLIYVERGGRVVRSREVFPSEATAVSVIERIVAPLGRRIDRSQPLVDARLPDGSRVNAVIPPLAVKGPCITIRKFPEQQVTIENLITWRSLTDSAVALLDACVKSRTNIIVAGGTGSGKTTLLNALSRMIPDDERIVTIEDAAELRLQQEHVVTMETRPPSAEGTGEYTIRDLVKNALRMRPDRIIVGECRGSEAIDMLQAMNTGHDGSMTSLHANTAEDTVTRLETMVLMAADIPLSAVRRQISDAIDLVVFIERLRGGRRMVTQVSEVVDIDKQTGVVNVRDIMRGVGHGENAELKPTGYMPTFLGQMVDRGLLDLSTWFQGVRT